MILTSPPFALARPKEYGNEPEEDYVEWFRPYGFELFRLLKPSGSLILDLGGAWKKRKPFKSLYQYRVLIDL